MARYAISSPASSAFAITPAPDTLITAQPRALWIGGAGNLVCRLIGDSADVTFTGVAAGTLLPIRVSHVRNTSTATLIVGLV